MGAILAKGIYDGISALILWAVMLPLGIILLGYLALIGIESIREIWKWRRK